MNEENMTKITGEISGDPYLREILITGGDPLTAPQKLKYLITKIATCATNIQFIRIGTRLPVQAPQMIDPELISFFDTMRNRLTIEIACQINHPYELQGKTIDVIQGLQKAGVLIYSQNVLLKGVNNNLSTLIELYDQLRYLRVNPHYFFHAVPLKGSAKFRTSVATGLDLIKQLTTSGLLSGRAKPQFALITDIGKINMYEGALRGRDGDHLVVQSSYKFEDRRIWNPHYKLPESASLLDDGTMTVKYLDGND